MTTSTSTATPAAAPSAKEQDLQLWRTWKKTKSNQDLQPLLNNLQPVINQQVNRWSGALATPLLETHAKILATDAIKTFNPQQGASLSTHVTNQLQKLSRIVYTHTQAARLPEHKAIAMTSFSVGYSELKDRLGREPTHAELSDHLGWTKGRTKEFQKAYNRQELLTSGEFQPGSFTVYDVEDPQVAFVYHDLAPQQQRIFEHITGYGGKPVLSGAELQKKFKLTQGQLSYQKQQLTAAFKKALD